jgi:hemerythrin superfamily protein
MAKTSATRQPSNAQGKPPQMDAIALLKADHDEVDALFKEFESVKDESDPEEIDEIVQKACDMLSLHAQLEEEIFYPAVRDGVEDVDELLNEADVEHGVVEDLIDRLEEMDVEDEMYAANVTVLAEYVKHHVKEEEGELFPKVRKSNLDLAALGAEMAARKQELRTEAAG